MKQYKNQIILSVAIILLPMLVGLMMYSKLPEQIPMHFNTNGEVDNFANKNVAIFVMPLIMVAIQAICLFATLNDPKKKNISDKVIGLIIWIVPLVSLITFFLSVGKAMGLDLNVNTVVMLMLGMIFIVAGNYLPKSRNNYTVGIRTPWTLSDDEIWNKTHRMAGKLYVAIGLLAIALSFINRPNLLIAFEFILITMAFVPVIYSYILFKKKQKDQE
ncbi:MAG: SdpI family protein [Erysipelotrichaceae bacterium]|nr:SdpI family protein [Erysipelotrichaceae bacterium]